MGKLLNRFHEFRRKLLNRKLIKKAELGADGLLLTDNTVDFAYVEAFNMFAVNLTYTLSSTRCKKVMFTSANPNSGKSISVVNVGISLAKMGKKVLIVDCDFANNSIAQNFGATGVTEGISDIVCNGVHAKDTVVTTEIDNLHYLSCGFPVPDPQRIVFTDEFKRIFDDLEEGYDWIIVDVPPINLFAYVSLVHSVCDGTVLVVDKKNDFTAEIEKALNMIKDNLIGLLVNKVERKAKRYGYEYSYGYGTTEK